MTALTIVTHVTNNQENGVLSASLLLQALSPLSDQMGHEDYCQINSPEMITFYSQPYLDWAQLYYEAAAQRKSTSWYLLAPTYVSILRVIQLWVPSSCQYEYVIVIY